MTQSALIQQELSMAEEALKSGNEGKTRVCARRAVALAVDAWLEKQSDQPFSGDALAHLRRIQQDVSLPLSIREAAERLSTTVPRKDPAPFTTDPIGDTRIIIACLIDTCHLYLMNELSAHFQILQKFGRKKNTSKC